MHDAVKPGYRPVRESELGLWTMVAIAVGVILIISVVIDVSCYFLSGCGVTMCICVKLCDRHPGTDEDDTAELKETNNRPADVEAATVQHPQRQPASAPPETTHEERGKEASAAELEKKVLEPREKEPLIRAHHDSGGRPEKEEKPAEIEEKKPLMSEATSQKEDDAAQQQQQQTYRQLSDDQPIENDVEHTSTAAAPGDETPAAISADSGAEEVGSPEQQGGRPGLSAGTAPGPPGPESPDQGLALDSEKEESPVLTGDSPPLDNDFEKISPSRAAREHEPTPTIAVMSEDGSEGQPDEVATDNLIDI